MKFATCLREGRDTAAVVHEDSVYFLAVPVREVISAGLDGALELGADALHGPATRLDEVRLRAPLQPSTMRDFVAFEEHVEGVRRSMDGGNEVVDAWYEAPRFYFTNPYTVSGPDALIRPPAACAELDFEMEVAAVVGKSGSHLTVADARDHIFGYTILNDWSARDIQRREMQVGLGPAKGKDFANSLGPWIVTADEFDAYRGSDGFFDVHCTIEVDGVRIGHDSLANMGWTFETLVAYASRDSFVRPGDVLGSGTLGNGGCLAELWGRRGEQSPPPLQAGNTVTITVEGIGSLTNIIGVARTAPQVPRARRADHEAIRSSRRSR